MTRCSRTWKFHSWDVADNVEAREYQVLGYQWVYMCKYDEKGLIRMFKARLDARGDQQIECELPTRATTLALSEAMPWQIPGLLPSEYFRRFPKWLLVWNFPDNHCLHVVRG